MILSLAALGAFALLALQVPAAAKADSPNDRRGDRDRAVTFADRSRGDAQVHEVRYPYYGNRGGYADRGWYGNRGWYGGYPRYGAYGRPVYSRPYYPYAGGYYSYPYSSYYSYPYYYGYPYYGGYYGYARPGVYFSFGF
jgi:hypothetical protein